MRLTGLGAAFLCGAVALAGIAAPASAGLVTFDFAGTVSSLPGELTASNYGRSFSGAVTFDTSAAGSARAPGISYPATAFAVTFAGGYSLVGNSPTVLVVDSESIPTSGPADASEIDFGATSVSGAGDSGFTPTAVEINLTGPLGFITSDALPSTPPAVAGASLGNSFAVAFQSSFTTGTIFGSLTSLTLPSTTPVPEPTSLAILGLGLVGLGGMRAARRPGKKIGGALQRRQV